MYMTCYMIYNITCCKQCLQVLGTKTWAGKCKTALGNHHCGKECLDVHLLKAAAHEAVADPHQCLVPCADDTQPEWVTYPYCTVHPILRWLPSKLAEWIAENLGEQLEISEKCGDKWTVEELNNILVNNLVSTGPNGGQLRTFGTIQWECELYRGRPKARCYPFNLDGHRFRGKNPQVQSLPNILHAI